MSYYQVLITTGQTSEQLLNLFVDLSEVDLQEKFLKPYQNGLNIFSGNTIYQSAQIKKVYIINTTEPDGIIRDKIHKKSLETIRRINESGSVVFLSAGNGYEAEDILNSGKDVTDEYLSTSIINKTEVQTTLDMAGKKPYFLLNAINNQWVVSILTGILFLALGLLLT